MSIFWKNNKWIEYRCSCCGAKIQRRDGTGKPDPGNCSRRNKLASGRSRAHVWVINRKYGK